MFNLQPRMRRGRNDMQEVEPVDEFYIDTTRIQLSSVISFMKIFNCEFNGRSFFYYDYLNKKRYLSFNSAQVIHNSSTIYIDEDGHLSAYGRKYHGYFLSPNESYKLVERSKLQYIKSLKAFKAQSLQVEFL